MKSLAAVSGTSLSCHNCLVETHCGNCHGIQSREETNVLLWSPAAASWRRMKKKGNVGSFAAKPFKGAKWSSNLRAELPSPCVINNNMFIKKSPSTNNTLLHHPTSSHWAQKLPRAFLIIQPWVFFPKSKLPRQAWPFVGMASGSRCGLPRWLHFCEARALGKLFVTTQRLQPAKIHKIDVDCCHLLLTISHYQKMTKKEENKSQKAKSKIENRGWGHLFLVTPKWWRSGTTVFSLFVWEWHLPYGTGMTGMTRSWSWKMDGLRLEGGFEKGLAFSKMFGQFQRNCNLWFYVRCIRSHRAESLDHVDLMQIQMFSFFESLILRLLDT